MSILQPTEASIKSQTEIDRHEYPYAYLHWALFSCLLTAISQVKKNEQIERLLFSRRINN